jgi:short-subunit dehydrogenase
MGAKIGASVLCPGFVNTNIFDAERHRPKELSSAASGTEPSAEMREMGRTMLAAGKQPAEVADIVFESIRDNRFYILPHPAWDPIVRARVDAILARGAPMTLDMQEMMKRRAAGEQF